MPKQATISAAQRGRFLEMLAETRNVTVAARAAGIARRAALALREADPDFALAWADAEEEATDLLEHAARRRAVEGWEEPVHYHGQEIGRVRRFSEELMLLFLRAERPGKFAERPGGGNGPAESAAGPSDGGARGRPNGSAREIAESLGLEGNVLVVPGKMDPETWSQQVQAHQRKLMASVAGLANQPAP